MAVLVPSGLPAVEALSGEGVRTVTTTGFKASLRIGVLNLMPLKINAETDLVRLLASSPLPVEIALFEPATHTSKSTSAEHLRRFYNKFSSVGAGEFDGFIITGAPVEKIAFEDVDYWQELCAIMDMLKRNVRSTLYICWAAFAGLYHHYAIDKKLFDKKFSGVFAHSVTTPCRLTDGFDDEFYVPHSRFVGFDRNEVASHPQLCIVAESAESGIYIIGEKDGRDFFITGHSEYAPMTLDSEYRRDVAKALDPAVPCNYYVDDNPANAPAVRWRSHARLLFNNWLNHYVSPDAVCGVVTRS